MVEASYIATILTAGTIALAFIVTNVHLFIFSILIFTVVGSILFHKLINAMMRTRLIELGAVIAALIGFGGSLFFFTGITSLDLLRLFTGVSYLVTAVYTMRIAIHGHWMKRRTQIVLTLYVLTTILLGLYSYFTGLIRTGEDLFWMEILAVFVVAILAYVWGAPELWKLFKKSE